MNNGERGSAMLVTLGLMVLLGIGIAGAIGQLQSNQLQFEQAQQTEQQYRLVQSGHNEIRRSIRRDRWWKADGQSDTYPILTRQLDDDQYTMTVTSPEEQPFLKNTSVELEDTERVVTHEITQHDPGLFGLYASEQLTLNGGRWDAVLYGYNVTTNLPSREENQRRTVYVGNDPEGESPANITLRALPVEFPRLFPYEPDESIVEGARNYNGTVLSDESLDNEYLVAENNLRVSNVQLEQSGIYGQKQLTVAPSVRVDNPPKDQPVFFAEKSMEIRLPTDEPLRGIFLSNEEIRIVGSGTIKGFVASPQIVVDGPVHVKPFRHSTKLGEFQTWER